MVRFPCWSDGGDRATNRDGRPATPTTRWGGGSPGSVPLRGGVVAVIAVASVALAAWAVAGGGRMGIDAGAGWLGGRGGLVAVWGLGLGGVGLVSQEGDRAAIERLIDRIDRFQAGEEVAFETDREDELGDLYAAVDRLADSARERRNDANESERYRRRLYRITADPDLDDEEKVGRLLELGCDRLDVECGAITRIDEETGRYEVERVEGGDFVEEGLVTDLSQTFCRNTVTSADILGIYDAVSEGYGEDPGHVQLGIGCYVGGKILVDDELYGTLCFVDPEARETPFTHDEKAFVDLMSRCVAQIYERRERERDLAEYREFTDDILDAVDDVYYILGSDGRLRRWNETLPEVTGYTDAELGEMYATDFFAETHQHRAVAAIETVLESGHAVFEAPILTSGDESPYYEFVAVLVEDPEGEPCIAGIGRDVSDRRERERELARTSDLLQQAGRIADIGGWEYDATTDPPEMTWTDQLYRLHGLPLDTDIDAGTAVDLYHPDDRERIRTLFGRAVETGEGYDMEVRLQTADGSERWVRAIGEPVFADDTGEGDDDRTVVSVRGSIQDITDAKERELALAALHETARELLGCETRVAAAERVVAGAADVLDVSCLGVYLLDVSSNRLEPAATSPGFADLCADAPTVDAGDDSPLWNAFVSGMVTVVDDGNPADRSAVFGPDVSEGLLVPIGDHGVFVAAVGDDTIDERTRRLVETLVATTEAALDRIETETELRERDVELAARNRRLERQIAVTDLIRRIDRSLVGATSREEIETAVPERLAATDDVAFAWIGGLDPAGETLEPSAWAGHGREYLDAVSLALEDPEPEPAATAARTREATVVGNVVDRLQDADWAKSAMTCDLHSAVAVPLVYEEYFYGVLAVYAAEPDAFDDLERTVFAELGEGIAHAINAVETRRALHADSLVELTLELDSSDALLGQLARETDSTVTYEGLASHTDEETRLFVSVADCEPAAAETVLEDLVSVREHRLVSDDDGALFEITVGGETLPSLLVRHGGNPRSLVVSPAGTEVVVDVPTATNVREFVEMLRSAYPSVELVGRRTVERDSHTGQELAASLLEGLTDRQLEVLRTAYFAGFFEWPRTSTGEDVAAMLGVTQPTVNRHLRLGQQRLLTQLFGDESPSDRTDARTARPADTDDSAADSAIADDHSTGEDDSGADHSPDEHE